MRSPSFKEWLGAARLRTLPLALSSIILAGFLAAYKGLFDWKIFILAFLTTVSLQVLSNFANDYGDSQNGADSKDRIGPARAVQAGLISQKQMLGAVKVFVVISLILGLTLIFVSFGGFTSNFFIFLTIGILAIMAAYFYTAGSRPYGYVGLGDLSVFIFFGLVGVLGSYYLYAKTFDPDIILPAVACGLLATGVLNINNIRDLESDKSTGKHTIPVKLGRKNALIYHWVLLSGSIFSILIFAFMQEKVSYYYLLSFPLIIINGIQVSKNSNPDAYLKTLALTSLATVLMLGFSLIY